MWTTSTTKSAEVRGSKNVLAKICIMSLWKGGACFVWPVQQQKKNNVKSWLLVHWKSWKSTFIQVKIHMRNVPFGNMISECFPLISKYRNEVHWIQFGKVQRLCANYNFLPTKTQCRPSSEDQSWLWPFSCNKLLAVLSNFKSEHNLGWNRLFLIQSWYFRRPLQMTGHTVQNLVNNSFLSHIEARRVIMAS